MEIGCLKKGVAMRLLLDLFWGRVDEMRWDDDGFLGGGLHLMNRLILRKFWCLQLTIKAMVRWFLRMLQKGVDHMMNGVSLKSRGSCDMHKMSSWKTLDFSISSSKYSPFFLIFSLSLMTIKDDPSVRPCFSSNSLSSTAFQSGNYQRIFESISCGKEYHKTTTQMLEQWLTLSGIKEMFSSSCFLLETPFPRLLSFFLCHQGSFRDLLCIGNFPKQTWPPRA